MPEREQGEHAGRERGIRGHRVRDPVRARQRRREILMAAALVFARKGFEAASVEDIASEAGVAKGHIYHYFLSKEQIFSEIRTASIMAAVEGLDDVLASGMGPREMLREALSRLTGAAVEPGVEHYATVLADPADLSEQARARIRDAQHEYEWRFQGILEKGIRQGIFIDEHPKLMTFTLLRAALSVATWYRSDGEWRADWVQQKVLDQLMRSVTRYE